ncbi:MAG: alpha-L-rhamnosidase N-terminal domain-containing protein [Candidatus Solibacter sp.]|nr:alpha-L-rhamnosidase N-terminal domain-containing protein [Candidatus Solibacter sp.]
MKYTIALAALACAAACGAACGAVLPPYELECEARRNPVGIEAAQPRLSWKLRAEEQSAYQIQAGTSAAATGLWDSGRVPSPETSWIAYGGPKLESFRRYWWRVRVWNAAGEASAWSDAAEWTQVPADARGWKGGWIAHPDHVLRSGPLPIFRKEVVIDKPLRRAIALVAGVGFHELRINGQKVGDHVLAPAWSNFRSTVYYESFDVTVLLASGANAIGVLLGNGFYNVAGGRYTKFTGSFGQPRVRVQVHLEYADGSIADTATDGTWRVTDGPITFSCTFGTRVASLPDGIGRASTIPRGAAPPAWKRPAANCARKPARPFACSRRFAR